MKKIFDIIFIILLCSITLQTGCASNKNSNFKNNNVDTTSKTSLLNMSSKKQNNSNVNAMRANILRETALSIGARGGLEQRTKQYRLMLSNYEFLLTRIFNFNRILLENNILPPVLIEARNTLNLNGDDVIRIQERNYEILQQARFVTAPPTWQDYLLIEYGSPEIPDNSLLPKNKAEKKIWMQHIHEGWEAGIAQANFIFKENLNRLKRDFLGMIRYRSLLSQNMVSAPFVASLDLGITGNDQNMSINDRILKITAFPSLQINSEQWKTEIYQYE